MDDLVKAGGGVKPSIKAIQTFYQGLRFRSRLEARWAVFFDSMGIEWRYEPECFQVAPNLAYLPDFFLPRFNAWVEIKPDEQFMSEEAMNDALPESIPRRKVEGLADITGPRVCVFIGDTPRSAGEFRALAPILRFSDGWVWVGIDWYSCLSCGAPTLARSCNGEDPLLENQKRLGLLISACDCTFEEVESAVNFYRKRNWGLLEAPDGLSEALTIARQYDFARFSS